MKLQKKTIKIVILSEAKNPIAEILRSLRQLRMTLMLFGFLFLPSFVEKFFSSVTSGCLKMVTRYL